MSIPELHDPETFKEFMSREDEFLTQLERDSLEEDVPIIGPHVGKLLYFLVKISGAKRILELGTANGYSSIWMAKALSGTLGMEGPGDGADDTTHGDEGEEDGRQERERDRVGSIVTLEWDEHMAEVARKNIELAGYSGLVEVIQGDARSDLAPMEKEGFDLIFLDVEKEFYSELLDTVVGLLRPGGVLFFDNTAFTTAGDFLERSSDHPQLETLHMYGFFPNHGPDYDAVTLCVKRS